MKKEGFNTPTQMVSCAKRKGLDCIALTDHDLVKGNKEAVKAGKKYDVVVIPGEEITTSGIDRKMRGHVLALGIQERIAPGLSVEETVDKIHEQGGVAVAAHPFDISRRGVREKASLCDAIEIFNAINIERLSNWRTAKFASACNLPGIAGTDAHSIDMLGYSYTLCNTDSKDVSSILKAIKNGKVRVHGRYVPSVVLTDWAVKRFQYAYDNAEKYVRNNYIYPKRIVALELMKMAKFNSNSSKYLLKLMGKMGVAGATGYSAIKMAFGL